MKLRKMGAIISCLALSFALVCVAGCASEGAQQETPDPVEASLHLPEVFVDDDGDLIQLTPYDTAEDSLYFQQKDYMSRNTRFIHADDRGCKSCHSDLRTLLEESGYEHPGLVGLDVEWSVTTCRGCHSTGTQGYFTNPDTFADLMHGVHMDVDTDCWNCHATAQSSMTAELTEDDGEMLLWEEVRMNYLRGFTDIAAEDLTGSFSFTQDPVLDQSDLFNLNMQYYDYDFIRAENTDADAPLDEELLESWTISVSGEVGEAKTFNLKELIDDESVPKETKLLKWHCLMNPVGGSAIGQVEATGIPLSYLLEQCGGMKETAVSLVRLGADGFQDLGGISMDLITDGTCMIVYEMNGEPLEWKNGYPCVFVCGGTATGCYVKEVSDLIFAGSDTPLFDVNGWPVSDVDTTKYNKPNVGIIGLKDGQVIETGKAFTIEGYADAFEEQITAIEISMDRGATWKTFETPDTNIEQWVVWSYEFTPEVDGTYYFEVRAVNDTGKVTSILVDRMITASSDIEGLASSAVVIDGENGEE